jgi:hypothetical protein
MTGEADAQRWRRHKRYCQALQVISDGLESVVIRAHNDVKGVHIREGGDLPLIVSPPLAGHGGSRESSGVSGQCDPHGVPQAILVDATVEADFQVDAPRLGDRVEVIAGLVKGAEGSPRCLGPCACLRLIDSEGLELFLLGRAVRRVLGVQSG